MSERFTDPRVEELAGGDWQAVQSDHLAQMLGEAWNDAAQWAWEHELIDHKARDQVIAANPYPAQRGRWVA